VKFGLLPNGRVGSLDQDTPRHLGAGIHRIGTWYQNVSFVSGGEQFFQEETLLPHRVFKWMS